MEKLVLIGIGTGNPDHLTLQAVKAMRGADLILIPKKGPDKSDLAGLRQCHHLIARGTDGCCAGGRFGEYTRYFIAGSRGKFRQIPKLALTRLV